MLQVHRQLLAVVESERRKERGERGEDELPANNKLTDFCRHMNTRHRVSQREGEGEAREREREREVLCIDF